LLRPLSTDVLQPEEERRILEAAEVNCNAGRLYENGWGVPTALAKAIECYQKAASRGTADDKAALTRLSGNEPPADEP